MKLLFKLHIIYYACLFLFVYLIPNPTEDAGIIKYILLFLSLGLMIAIALFYILIAFDKKYLSEKKSSYFFIVSVLIELNIILILGHLIYAKIGNLLSFYAILAIFFLTNTMIQVKMKASLLKKNFQPWEEAKLLVKFGDVLKGSPILNAITKLDRMYIVFAIAVGIAEEFYIFAVVVGIILIFSFKHLLILKNEFLKSKLITKRETYFSIIFYYFCYLVSIVWGYFIPNFSIIMVGITGIFFIKLYIHRIVLKVYEEGENLIDKNNFNSDYL